jgi:hypothetical protein
VALMGACGAKRRGPRPSSSSALGRCRPMSWRGCRSRSLGGRRDLPVPLTALHQSLDQPTRIPRDRDPLQADSSHVVPPYLCLLSASRRWWRGRGAWGRWCARMSSRRHVPGVVPPVAELDSRCSAQEIAHERRQEVRGGEGRPLQGFVAIGATRVGIPFWLGWAIVAGCVAPASVRSVKRRGRP